MKPANTQIQSELTRIELECGVRVLFAAESGSRVWGFASRDSDQDIRFIYCAFMDRIPKAIDRVLPGRLRFSGCDVRHALHLAQESRSELLEWLKSPAIHRVEPAFALYLGLLASEFYSGERLFRHYLREAEARYRAQPWEETGGLGRYLEVLRPLLACRWIEQCRGAVPLSFQMLADTTVEDPAMRVQIAVIVARKRGNAERVGACRIPAVDRWIEAELGRLEKQQQLSELSSPDRKNLEELLQAFCLAEAA